jgi:uncharacterized protein (DUF1015 family)
MTLVSPVRARLVSPAWAARVVSPLHDVLTEAERRAVMAANPDSYLHVTSDPTAPGEHAPGEVQAAAQRRLLDLGAYACAPEPSVFVYRMGERTGDLAREHTGVVAAVDLAGFADGRVLGHERVQPGRVEGLVRHFAQVPMRSELVALFHRGDPDVVALTERVCQDKPVLEVTDAGGIEQTVWRASQEQSEALARHLSGHRHYIADGHHRVAAALRAWESDGRPDGASVLCAIYPQDQLSLHAFHRRVRGPVDVRGLLDAVTAHVDVRRAEGPEVVRGSVGLYAAGGWHVLTPAVDRRPDGVAGLDVSLLEERVLRPLLDVAGDDARLEFVPDVNDLAPTLRACDEDGGVLFTLHAPALDDLVSVAERHEVMSAKTTYVRPKPRTGVFLR